MSDPNLANPINAEVATAIDIAIDGAGLATESTVPSYAKLGNLSTMYDIALALHSGEPENAAQAIGVAAASSLAGTAAVVAVGAFVSLPAIGAVIIGAGVAWGVGELFNNEIDRIQEDPFGYGKPDSGANPDAPASKTYRIQYYDPLALDLNGDGVIKTISSNELTGVLFDNDSDGVRTATGWVSPEDGLLVRDINNDGLINNGSELFGDNTKLSNGDNAENGFSALSDLDSNNDGRVDSSDEKFNELKIWKDINGDGISQSDELFTLNDVGVKSLSTGVDSIQNEVVEGAIIAETGSFERLDNSIGFMADLNFEKNDTYSKYISDIEISDEVKLLANIKGYGRLKDFHQYSMESDSFKNILIQYHAAETREEQTALLDSLMHEWMKSDPEFSNSEIKIYKPENIAWAQSDDAETVIMLTPGQQLPSYIVTLPVEPEVIDSETALKIKFVDSVLGLNPTKFIDQASLNKLDQINEIYDGLKKGLFNQILNETLLKPYLDAIDMYVSTEGYTFIFDYKPAELLLLNKYETDPLTAFKDLKDLINLNGFVLNHIGWESAFILFNDWKDELSNNPLFSEEVNSITIEAGSVSTENSGKIIFAKDEGENVSADGGDDILISGRGDDYLQGGHGNNNYIFGLDAGEDFVSYINDGEGTDKITITGVKVEDVIFYQNNNNLIVGYGNGSVITILGALDPASSKSLFLKFDDQILDINHIKTLPLSNYNLSGSQTYINGWRGADVLDGNSESNQIYGFDGNDILRGNEGADDLFGGSGSDTYVFKTGDGVDQINEDNYALEVNIIKLEDVFSTNIEKVFFEGNDLILIHNLDKLIIKNYINDSADSLLEIHFGDGLVWNNSTLMNLVKFEGTSEDDLIRGILDHKNNVINAFDGNDTVLGNQIASNEIYGGSGNDTLHGGNTHDTLNGGADDDFIFGQDGNDNLEGGDGNDTLMGGDGNDVIVGGEGNDWLQGDGGADILLGGRGDDSYDVDDLDTLIENPDEGYDTIFIENDFDLTGTNLEAIRLKGSDDFRAIGDEKENELYGNAGDNYLDGKAGADFMSGGAGNDYYIVDQYDKLITNQDGTTTLIHGDQVVEGLLNPAGNVFGDSSGIDTVEQWDDHRFYSQDVNGNWFDTGSYHLLQSNVENLILRGQAKVGFGNELDNIIIGNDQDNFIDGQGGNDTYIYTKGSGTDTFNFEDINSATNILKIEGHDASQMYGQKFGDSVLLGFKNSTDKIWLSNYALNDYLDNDGNTITYKFDEIRFDSGAVLTTFDVDTLVTRAENNQAPVVDQYPSTLNVKIDEVLQYTFNNVISDPDLDDQLSYTLTMQTQDSNGDYQAIPDWVVFDPETLTVTVSPQEGIDVGQLSFYLWGTDLYGVGTGVGVNINIQPSASTPIPGAIYDTAGNDILIGGTEDNIFFYTGGRDTIQEAGGVDILRFSNGITFNEVGSGLTKSGNDLILKVNGSSANQVTLKNYFLAGDNLVETIDFETGGQLTAEQLFNAFGLTLPSSGGDTGSGSSDPVGDTTYSYSSGELTITEVSGTDKVVFASGITFSQIGNYMTMSGNDLILKVNGSTTNKITVKNFFLAGNNLVETFKFSTGEEITADDIFGAFGLTLPSTGGGAETGSSEVEGDTTYEYTTGALMINEVSGNDKVVFKNGITFSQIGNYLNMSGNDLILKLDGSNTNKVTVKDFFLGGDYVVETFAFETGGQITASQIFGAFGLTMPAATSLASMESFSFDEESNMSSDEVYQDFGTNSPLNAEDIVQSVITGDAGDNLFISDSALSELFILNDGQDIIKLMQNTSGVTAVDYVNDFKISEDQLDLSEFLDNSQVNSSNLDEFLTISYDENLKTNTISVTGDASGNSQEILILTNQAEFLSVQDLLLNQSIVY